MAAYFLLAQISIHALIGLILLLGYFLLKEDARSTWIQCCKGKGFGSRRRIAGKNASMPATVKGEGGSNYTLVVDKPGAAIEEANHFDSRCINVLPPEQPESSNSGSISRPPVPVRSRNKSSRGNSQQHREIEVIEQDMNSSHSSQYDTSRSERGIDRGSARSRNSSHPSSHSYSQKHASNTDKFQRMVPDAEISFSGSRHHRHHHGHHHRPRNPPPSPSSFSRPPNCPSEFTYESNGRRVKTIV